jgi:MEDS: MEthanogen/methylotroph, DcmR Sensory domain
MLLRNSPLFQFRHGDHTCLFYRSEDTLMDVLTPYIAEGILRGERCFCAQNPEVLKRLLFDLRFLGIDTDREIRRGSLDLHTEDEAYFVNQRFEPQAMIEMLMRTIEEARENGFAGLRTAGEMGWAVRGRNECDNILGYEKLVEESFPGKAAIGLCQYAVDEFRPDILDSVLESHRLHFDERKGTTLHSSIHVHFGQHGAEIVADKLTVDPRYYYVVQQVRPREIVGWGVAPNFDSATARAEQLARDSAETTALA